MKKILLLIIAPFAFLSGLPAQSLLNRQGEADEIVLERLSQEKRSCTVYAKERRQDKITITSSAGELIELDYSCWVYYIRYADNDQGRYLIVNYRGGNLLEVNVKSDTEPIDMPEKWRIEAPIEEIPFTEYSLAETPCKWKGIPSSNPYPYRDTIVVINSNEDLEKYLCERNTPSWGNCVSPCSDYPAIDFSKYTLLFAQGMEGSGDVFSFNRNLRKLSEQSYAMTVDLKVGAASVVTNWQVPIIVSKLNDECIIDLIVIAKQTRF